jgi:ATP-binding cassette subfamily B protein
MHNVAMAEEQPKLRRMGFEPDDGPRSLRRLPALLADATMLVWRASPRLVLTLLALQIASAAGFGVSVLVFRQLVSLLQESQRGHLDFVAVLPPLGLLTALLGLMAFGGSFSNSVRMMLSELVSEAAFQPVADVATAMDLEAYESSDFHDRLGRALNASGRPFMITQSLMQLAGSLATLVGLVVVLLVLQPLLIPTLVLTLVPLLVAASAFSRDFRLFSLQFSEHERRRQYIRGLLTGGGGVAKEVRAYGLTDHFRELARRMFERRMEELRRIVRRGSVRSLLSSVAGAAAITATIGVLIWFVLNAGMSLATATAAALAIVGLAPQVASLAFSTSQLYENALFLEDLNSFRALLPKVVAAKPSGPAPAAFGVLRLQDVGFTYPGSERRALDGISLTVRKGEIVALVGENGSGKTTLAKLLSGLYRPHSGQICWDGTDVSQVDADQLRRGIAVVFQDFGRYLFTAGDNIAMGRIELAGDHEAVERAARRAGANEFIGELPKGYETMLGKMYEGGEELSVGQWQRMALARAFFRDAPFVILDEPTAALDARAEHDLFESIRTLFAGRTVLLISHRFSSVLSADRIFVLDKGRLVEQGSHAELMAASGLYSELFTLQAQAYRDAGEARVSE